MQPRSQEVLEKSRQCVLDVWRNVMNANYGSMTPIECAQANQAFDAASVINTYDNNNVLTALMNLQDRSGGQLAYNQIYSFLTDWLARFRQGLARSMGAMQAPVGGVYGYNTGMPVMEAAPGMYGNMPMGGFGQTNMYNPPAQVNAPYNAGMPTQAMMNAASMYGFKPSQPPMQQPHPQPVMPVQTNTPMAAPAPVQAPMPSTKLTRELIPYKEPMIGSSKDIGKTGTIDCGEVTTWTDQTNKTLRVVKLHLSKWVKKINSAVAEMVDRFNPAFMQMKYRTYHIEKIAYGDLAKAFADVKSVIQNAKAAEEPPELPQILKAVLETLNDKSTGVSRVVQKLIIEKYQQVVYTLQMDFNTFGTDSVDRIIDLYNGIKDVSILEKLTFALDRVLNDVLLDTQIHDITSDAVASAIDQEEVGTATVRSLRQDTEKFAQWAKDRCVVLSEEKTIIWTTLPLKDTIMNLDGDDFTIRSQSMDYDASPADSDLECFIKSTTLDPYKVASLTTVNENACCNYLLVVCNHRYYLRGAGMF